MVISHYAERPRTKNVAQKMAVFPTRTSDHKTGLEIQKQNNVKFGTYFLKSENRLRPYRRNMFDEIRATARELASSHPLTFFHRSQDAQDDGATFQGHVGRC